MDFLETGLLKRRPATRFFPRPIFLTVATVHRNDPTAWILDTD